MARRNDLTTTAGRRWMAALLGGTALGLAPAAIAQTVYNGNHYHNGDIFIGTEVTVGAGAVGTLDISGNASHVNSGDFYIGRDAGGDGTVTIDTGPGWADSSGDLYIGSNGGVGLLSLAEGGRFNVGDGAGTIYMADSVGSQGALVIGVNPVATTVEAGQIVFGLGDGLVTFAHDEADYDFGVGFSGDGEILQSSGVTRLTGDGSGFSGLITVDGGTMLIDGDMGSAAVDVAAAGRFGGGGSTTGDVVMDGGVLTPGGEGAAGTLTLGSLVMGATTVFEVDLGAPGVIGGSNDLVDVIGDLTLDGTLNVADAGAFGGGLYRLMNYGGTLTDNGLEVGDLPGGFTSADMQIQTGGGQVNLLNSAGLTLSFWDGDAPANFENDAVDGGDGVWSATGETWTNTYGDANGLLEVPPGLAIFSGTAGTVTIDASGGAVTAEGLQFFVDGYALEGDALTLTEAQTVVRVGDGTAGSAAFEATIASDLVGSGGLDKTDYGVLVLSGSNTYSGQTTITLGTLALSGGAAIADTGAVVLADAAGAILRVDDSERIGSLSGGGATGGEVVIADGQTLTTGAAGDTNFAGVISGDGGLEKTGAGVFTLSGLNTYAGATTVSAGTLQAGRAGAFASGSAFTVDATLDLNGFNQTVGSLAGSGTVTNGAGSGTARLTVGGDNTSTQFDGVIQNGSAAMALTKTGSGTLTLAGDSAYTGTTVVSGGTLSVTGSLSGTNVSVTNATLNGSGAIAGTVTVNSGGVLAPGAGVGTLTIGELLMTNMGRLSFELGEAGVAGASDLLTVTGDVTLRGQIDIVDAGDFGPGVYRLIDYGGSLFADTATIGSRPAGVAASELSLQTSVENQINLISTTGLDLLFWDGGDAAGHNNGAVDGGDGVWSVDGQNWTDETGVANGAMRPYPGFAVFQGDAGVVTVQGVEQFFPGSGIFEPLLTTGMQFAVDGYVLNGDALGFSGQTTFRVGDGSADGADYSARIENQLTGSGTLVKTDLGTLVLAASNSFSGGSVLRDGTIRLEHASALSSGALTAEGGTLDYASGLTIGNAIVLDGDLTLNQTGGSASQSGVVSGAGDLLKTGDGNLSLTRANTFVGATTVDEGRLTLASGSAIGTTSAVTINTGAELALSVDTTVASLAGGGDVLIDDQNLTINGAASTEFSGGILGDVGGLIKSGAGVLTLSGDSDFGGELRADGGEILLTDGGSLASGMIWLDDATATVSGSGSQWTNSGGLVVGDAATGAFSVVGGASYSTDSLTYVGNEVGSAGTIVVSGDDSSFVAVADIYLGYSGSGDLQIDSGGQVSNIAGFVGAGGSGTARVTGDGSEWINSDILHVGYFASGLLEIADGGVVRVDGGAGVVNVGFNTGSSGVLAIGAAEGDPAVAAGSLDAGEVRFGLGSSTLVFNHTDEDYTFAPLITGAGGVNHYSGTTILTADNTWTGATFVHGGTLVIEGASNQGAGAYHVGRFADDDGALILRDAGTIESGNVTIGTDSGAIGAVTITGAGSAWDASGSNVRVGESGEGSLTILDGGALSSFYGTIGTFADSSGAATVSGANSTWTMGDQLSVGSGGDGVLTVADGGDVSADQIFIASAAGSTGDVTVEGEPSSLSSDAETYVGYAGAGSLTVTDGGLVESAAGWIGFSTGSTGEAAISGVGSSWSNSGSLIVGSRGAATLEVGAGATVSSAVGYVGQLSGSVGNASVDGDGSSWTNSGRLYVGDAGSGTLSISDEGTVTNTIGAIANTFGSTGAVTVSGSGSLWSNSSYIDVGRAGVGSLTITDDALVQAGTSGQSVVNLAFSASGTGVLNIGADGGSTAAAAGRLEADGVVFGSGSGLITFNHTDTDYEFSADISGAQGAIDIRAGLTTLTGNNLGFTGDTTIFGGGLRVADVLGGDVTVSGGSLGGEGTVLGAVSVGAGSLTGQAGSVFTMGSLTLGASSILDVALGAPDANALFDVTGDLTLDGTLDIADAGGFGAGVYGLITYGGTLTDEGLEIGDLPIGYTENRLQVQTSVAGQVNLVNAGPADLIFWDGGAPANADNGAIDGGDGAWTLTGETWTDVDGAANGAMLPMPGLAVFIGAPGTVTLDDSAGDLSATGLQFASDGYVLTGDVLNLVEDEAGDRRARVRVGDGTAAGAAITATIHSDIISDRLLLKTDLGELVLTGDLTLVDDLRIQDGTLTLDGGTSVTDNDVRVADEPGDDAVLVIRNGAQLTNLVAEIGRDTGSRGVATVTGQGSVWNAGDLAVGIDGDGALTIADGATVSATDLIVASNAGSAGVINIGAAAAGAAGAAGVLDTATVAFGDGAGSLVFNHTDGDYVFAPQITGLGDVIHLAGVTTLTGSNDYSGTTRVSGGTLVIAGDSDNGGGFYFVGDQAGQTGTLALTQGVTVDSGIVTLGSAANATGLVMVDGATWNAQSNVVVGESGEGVLTVQNGGAINTDQFIVGGFQDSSGVATFDGAGTALDASISVVVGYFGDGDMTVSNGAAVNTMAVGVGGEGDGVLTLQSGATWTNSTAFYVGLLSGPGAVSVESGATLISADSVIGRGVGSVGQVTVSDAGSAWSAGDLQVGAEGLGLLTVQDQGLVTAGTMRVGVNGVGGLRLTDGGTLTADTLIVAENAGSQALIAIGAQGADAAEAAGVLDVDALTFGDGDGYLVFNHTDADYVFDTAILGAGSIEHIAGVTTLSADNSGYVGVVEALGGTLLVDGAIGAVDVADGGSLGGVGTIDTVAVADGGTLLGVAGQTLTMGSLELSDASNVDVILGAPSADGLFNVTGDLVLDGVLNVTDAGGFGAGVYRLFDYGGALTDNGLEIGVAPSGVAMGDLEVQTAVDGQVNLISAAGAELLFWDGGNAALHGNGAVNGGSGTWVSGGDAWTTADGVVNGPYRPNPGFAVFQGTAGTVTVDGDDIGVTGMQFAVDGYEVEGDSVELTEALTTVRVGDGTAAGADMTATIAASLTGAGTLVKTDLGTLILTGANSYAGGVQVRDGTLIGDTAALIGDINNDAVLVFDQGADANFAGAISGDGQTIKRGDGVLTLTGASGVDWSVDTGGLSVGDAAFMGDVDVAAGASLTFTTAAETTWSGVLTGDGDFAKTGASTLTLTGDSSDFDGVTTIVDGSLFVNGALGGETVIEDGGFLGGSGAIGQLTIAEGAVVSPGNSIGTLDVNGDLVFEAGSVFEVEVDPTGTASDLIAVTGAATLEGGIVRHIGFAGDYGPSSAYTILTADGGVTGTFDSVETDFAFLDASLDYEADAVFLSLERNQVAFPDVGVTANQQATGAGVESTGMGAGLYDAVVGLSADQARLAFDQLSGELHGSVRSSLIEDATWIRGVAQQRARAFDPAVTGLQFWGQAHGAVGRMETDGNAASLRSRSGGVWVGADAILLPGLMLGVAGGADRAEFDSTARNGEGERDGYRLAAYGSGQWGAFGLSVGVSGAWDDIETTRTPTFQGFNETLEADYGAETIQTFAEATWSIPAGAAVIQPFANVARISTETDGFTETGGDGALTVDGQTQDVTLATLGLGASRAWDNRATGRSASLNGRIGWRTASGDLDSTNSQAFVGGAPFTVEGLPVEDDVFVAEIGAAIQVRDTVAVTVDYSAQAGDRTTAQRLSAGLRWRF